MNSAYQEGQRLAAEHKDDAALLAFETALAQESMNYKAAFGIGLMLQRKSRHQEAVQAFTKVLEIQRRIPQVHYSRGISLQALGRYVEALTDIDIALDLDPGYIDAIYARGVSLKHLDRDEEAMEAYDVVLGKTGAYPPASHGRATLRSRNGDCHGAISDFTTCIEAGMDSYDIRLLRGLVYYRVGMLEEARHDLTCAISLNPTEGSTYIRRWQVLKDIGESDLADADLERGTRLMRITEGREQCGPH